MPSLSLCVCLLFWWRLHGGVRVVVVMSAVVLGLVLMLVLELELELNCAGWCWWCWWCW